MVAYLLSCFISCLVDCSVDHLLFTCLFTCLVAANECLVACVRAELLGWLQSIIANYSALPLPWYSLLKVEKTGESLPVFVVIG